MDMLANLNAGQQRALDAMHASERPLAECYELEALIASLTRQLAEAGYDAARLVGYTPSR